MVGVASNGVLVAAIEAGAAPIALALVAPVAVVVATAANCAEA